MLKVSRPGDSAYKFTIFDQHLFECLCHRVAPETWASHLSFWVNMGGTSRHPVQPCLPQVTQLQLHSSVHLQPGNTPYNHLQPVDLILYCVAYVF